MSPAGAVAPTDDDCLRALEQHGSKAAAARSLGIHVNTFKDRVRRLDLPAGSRKPYRPEPAGAELHGDTATVRSEPALQLGDVEKTIRDAGLDPADWEIGPSKLNWWDVLARGGDDPLVLRMHQLTVSLKRKVNWSWIFPATDVPQRPAPKPRKHKGEPELVVFLPDPHCPFHDVELDKRVCDWLNQLQPDRVVCLGDVCDFSSISRHRDNPAWMSAAQENIQSAYEWWASKREAAPNALMDFIEGNHDARLRTELLTRAERMYGIKPAEIPGEGPQHDALSLRRLLHLDRLNVNFVGPPLSGDEYFHGQLDLAPDLCARHGFLTGAKSVEHTMDKLGMSVVFGHIHRQTLIRKAVYRGPNLTGYLTAMVPGTLACVQGGMGYSSNPNWQQGAGAAHIWPDGSHDLSLATYDGRALAWQGRRF